VPLPDDPHGDLWSKPRRMAELVQLASGGTACLADAAGFPLGPRQGVLGLWHSGQGGEVARAYYGTGERLDRSGLVERLYRAFVGRRVGRHELLSPEGGQLVRAQIASFVDEQLTAGAAPVDVPDLFYLLRRMGTWAGPSHGCVEFVRDTTAPLWSARLLEHELGIPADGRSRELFHFGVLRELAADLVDVPFEDGHGWPGLRPPLARRVVRARTLGRKGGAELARRLRSLRRRAPAPAARRAAPAQQDRFASVHADVSESVRSEPGHPAWRLLDRGRVERLLERDPSTLDTMNRHYVWRLAQVFWLDG
jgi:hypothetical protein